jgi:hypothetical protein
MMVEALNWIPSSYRDLAEYNQVSVNSVSLPT